MIDATRCPSLSCPRSTSSITLVAVATGLVIDAMSNTVSVVIGSSLGCTCLLPYALSSTIFPRRPMQTTHPGIRFSASPSRHDLVDPRQVRAIHADRFRLGLRQAGRRERKLTSKAADDHKHSANRFPRCHDEAPSLHSMRNKQRHDPADEKRRAGADHRQPRKRHAHAAVGRCRVAVMAGRPNCKNNKQRQAHRHADQRRRSARRGASTRRGQTRRAAVQTTKPAIVSALSTTVASPVVQPLGPECRWRSAPRQTPPSGRASASAACPSSGGVFRQGR